MPFHKRENEILKISQKFSLKYLIFTLLINFLIFLPYAYGDLLNGSFIELFLELIIGLSAILTVFLLYKFKMEKSGDIIFALVFSLLWIYFFLNTDENSISLLFFLIFPPIITMVLDYQKALTVNIVMLLIFSAIYSIDFQKGTISLMSPLAIRIGSVFLMNFMTMYLWKKRSIEKMEEINNIALYDSLTGIANKKHFDIYIENIIHASSNNENRFSLLFLDIDDFKKINDNPGHEVGNKVLRDVASRINRCLEGSDSLFRVGGDEFIAIIPRIDDDYAPALLARKILSVEEAYLNLPTLSIGIANFPEDGTSRNELVQKSENAMYEAKKNGKNSFSFFHKEFNKQINKRSKIEKLLRSVSWDQELSVVFQPKLETEEMKIIGAEALIRWDSPLLGPVSPSDFITIAEDTDIIHKLSTWVYSRAFTMLKELQDSGHSDFILSVNVSPMQIRKNTLIQSLNTALEHTSVNPRSIELEITEGLLLGPEGNSSETLRYLRQQGFRISIDDFGTGYSSLSYLQNLNLDSIKIDKSFINNLHHKNVNSIIKTIISLADSMNLQTIAEGVETKEQLETLKDLGCHIIQGYYFSKAVCKEEIMKLLSVVVIK